MERRTDDGWLGLGWLGLGWRTFNIPSKLQTFLSKSEFVKKHSLAPTVGGFQLHMLSFWILYSNVQ
jgi:hypothetical protein